jgi:hypothetical protein
MVDDWEVEEILVELVSDDVDAVVPEAVLVEVLLIVVVRTPMQMYCMVFVDSAADPVTVEK